MFCFESREQYLVTYAVVSLECWRISCLSSTYLKTSFKQVISRALPCWGWNFSLPHSLLPLVAFFLFLLNITNHSIFWWIRVSSLSLSSVSQSFFLSLSYTHTLTHPHRGCAVGTFLEHSSDFILSNVSLILAESNLGH
jgi:hypothetical protein